MARRIGALLAGLGILLLCPALFTRGWFCGDDYRHWGLLSVLFCGSGDCYSGSLAHQNIDSAFPFLGQLAFAGGLAVLVALAATLWRLRSKDQDKGPPKPLLSFLAVFAVLSLLCATFFVHLAPVDAARLDFGFVFFSAACVASLVTAALCWPIRVRLDVREEL